MNKVALIDRILKYYDSMRRIEVKSADEREKLMAFYCQLAGREMIKKGYGKIMMESIRENAARSLEYDEVYLFTGHVGLYEKFGWEFVKEIDTHMEMEGIARLYRLPLR